MPAIFSCHASPRARSRGAAGSCLSSRSVVQLPCGGNVCAIVVDVSVGARTGNATIVKLVERSSSAFHFCSSCRAPERQPHWKNPSSRHARISRFRAWWFCDNGIRAGGGECEVHHMHIAAPALLLRAAGGGLSRTTAMTMRRMMSWWFRFVVSGRFFDRFLSLPRAPRA
ncbi:hypothetical protein ACSHT2_21900 [Bradyrhizobium sp. PUT101]|uniref:hypothetical protein n=1 Tax=Bradyrhizobium sp. PUT101 TaxID=3447427 RepID=UPI003F878C87